MLTASPVGGRSLRILPTQSRWPRGWMPIATCPERAGWGSGIGALSTLLGIGRDADHPASGSMKALDRGRA